MFRFNKICLVSSKNNKTPTNTIYKLPLTMHLIIQQCISRVGGHIQRQGVPQPPDLRRGVASGLAGESGGVTDFHHHGGGWGRDAGETRWGFVRCKDRENNC